MCNRFARTALFAAFLSAAGVVCATPYPGYYYPSGVRTGETVRVIAGGTGMGGIQGAYVTGEGVKVTKIIVVPTFPRASGRSQIPWIEDWIFDILEGEKRKPRKIPPEAEADDTDWAECDWWFHVDQHDDLELSIMLRWFATPESYPQPTPALDQLVVLDVAADADAALGLHEIIMYDGSGASAPFPFYVGTYPRAREEYFVLPSRTAFNHRRLPDALHVPTPIEPQEIPCSLDGQDWPGEVDVWPLKLEKGKRLVCSFVGRELLPYLGDAVPGFFNPEIRLVNADGKRVARADDFYYLPDPVLTYDVPEDGVYKLEVCDNLYRGRSDFVYIVDCFYVPDERPVYTPQQRAFECHPPAVSHLPPKPGDGRDVISGTLDCPGRVDRHYFEITEPGIWQFELFARRLGSPIDGVLKLYGPMGNLPLSSAPLVATWDDVQARLFALLNVGDDEHPIIKTNRLFVGSVPQVECDPIGQWKFIEPGRYCVTVSDRVGLGGENYDYTLVRAPVEPTFEVYAEQSSLIFHENRAPTFKAHLLRLNGYDGNVEFDSSEDWDVFGEFDAESRNIETTVKVEPKRESWEGVYCVDLTATGTDRNGKKKKVRVTPCDSVEQAFAYTHFLPQRGFFFCAPMTTNVVAVNTNEVFSLPSSLLENAGAKKGDGAAGGKNAAAGKQTMKKSHSGGKACISCHDKKTRKHTRGKNCTSCHTDRK